MILIIAGFTDRQIAPIMGLIGAIAGYVFAGKDHEDKTTKTASETKAGDLTPPDEAAPPA